MTRCKSWIAIIALLIVATAIVSAATPQKAEAATLRARLRIAHARLDQARLRLKAAQAALDAGTAAAAAPAAAPPVVAATDVTTTVPAVAVTPPPSLDQLKAKVAAAARAVSRLEKRVRLLQAAYRTQRRLAAWASQGRWRPIITVAAARYHVNGAGIYRMMLRESGGRRFAGSGTAFQGLFQYYPGTWHASWNPWRSASIYNGMAQIFATCYAVHKGMGPRMWANTFASAY